MLRLHYDLAFVEHGPIPPHERTWRHPSEVAAQERTAISAEPSSAITRFFAITTGTLGLLAVGALLVSVTPRRQDAPSALGSTTSAVVGIVAPDREGAETAGQRAGSTPALAIRSTATTVLVPTDPVALATRVGPGRLAVVTRAAMPVWSDQPVPVRMPTGRLHTARMLWASTDVVVVELSAPAPSGGSHDVARRRPASSDQVVVMSAPPIVLDLADIASIDVPEGTAVVDTDGDLIGVCSHAGAAGALQLVDVSVALSDAATAAP